MDLETLALAGKYIVAVSGGVDSVVLLDLLARQIDLELIVAHFDHGIRPESSEDAEFVKTLAQTYNLPFESERINLGPDASESLAREKRYAFLQKVRRKHHAKAIITAHHQDDVIETSMINLSRGTGRSGLTSLKSGDDIVRPLLKYPKADLQKYAELHNLAWRDDATNLDTKYLRNKIRHEVVAQMTKEQRAQWLKILDNAQNINTKLDYEIQNLLRRGLHKNQAVLRRGWYATLPHDIAKEVVHAVLRKVGARDIDKKTIERLTVQLKTLAAGKQLQAGGVDILLTKRSARFTLRGSQEAPKHV